MAAKGKRAVPRHPAVWAAAGLGALLLAGAGGFLVERIAAPAERAATIGGPFTLVDQDGKTVTDADFRGKWLLVYFGYTHCPDACPTALSDIAAALDQLEPGKRDKVRTLFVTVDPVRDTPAIMKAYADAFPGGNVVGLTGSPEQVAKAEKAYRVYARKHEKAGDPAEYDMDHSSIIYVMDPAGRFVANFTQETQPEQIAARLLGWLA